MPFGFFNGGALEHSGACRLYQFVHTGVMDGKPNSLRSRCLEGNGRPACWYICSAMAYMLACRDNSDVSGMTPHNLAAHFASRMLYGQPFSARLAHTFNTAGMASFGIECSGSESCTERHHGFSCGSGSFSRFRTVANAFLDECELFPNGAHDDMVDAATRALAELSTPEDYVQTIVYYDPITISPI